MPETRAAAKRRRIAEMTPLSDLPLNVLAQILSCLDVGSLVQTAGCNRALRYQVFEEHAELWQKIDFGELSVEAAAQVTDQELHNLLYKCHAHNRCQVLKLHGCIQLTGRGLEPLRGSCVLREIDLRLDLSQFMLGPVELDTTFVLPLLSSMPPIATELIPQSEDSLGLALVKIRPQNNDIHFFSRFQRDIGEWYRRFAGALQMKATERRLQCGHCHGVISEIRTREDMWWVIPTGYCECCQKYSCNEKRGCPLTNDCNCCLMQLCDKCPTHEIVFDCESCNRIFCEQCFDGVTCANYQCNSIYCDECENQCLECAICGIVCPNCMEAHENGCYRGGDEENSSSANDP